MALAWPRATAGTLLAYADDVSTGSLALEADDTAGRARPDRGTDTEIYIPAGNSGRVAVSGSATLGAVVSQPDGSRLAYVAPDPGPGRRGAGPVGATGASATYTVTVGPAVRDGTLRRVRAAADHPLPPITEPEARAAVEAALAGAEHSTDPKVRAASGLAGALAALLLPAPDPNGPVSPVP